MTDEALTPSGTDASSDDTLSPSSTQADAAVEATFAAQADADEGSDAKVEKPEKLKRKSTRDVVKDATDKVLKESDDSGTTPGEEKAKTDTSDPKTGTAKAVDADDDDGSAAPDEEKPRKTAFKTAPQRFDDAAKAEWDNVPESVRGAIHRAVRETEQGIEKHREAAQAFAEVADFAKLAQESGTTLRQALENYVSLERLIRQSPIAGFEQLMQNLDLRDGEGRQMAFKDFAEAYLRRSPVENQNASLQAQLAMLQRQQQEQALRQQEMERRNYVSSLRETAIRDYPRFEELRATMLGLVQSGEVSGSTDAETMRLAYERAAEMFPASVGHTDEAVAQTRANPQKPARRRAPTPARAGNSGSNGPRTLRDVVSDAVKGAGL